MDTIQVPGIYLAGDDMTIDSIYAAIYSFNKIDFDYQSKISLDSIKLTIITVYPSDTLCVILDSVNLNSKNLTIESIFPNMKEIDRIGRNNTYYMLLSYGIYISIVEKNNSRFINRISVFPK